MPSFDFYRKESGEFHSRETMTLTEARLKAKRLHLNMEKALEKKDNLEIED